jgi:hypothetical protein
MTEKPYLNTHSPEDSPPPAKPQTLSELFLDHCCAYLYSLTEFHAPNISRTKEKNH